MAVATEESGKVFNTSGCTRFVTTYPEEVVAGTGKRFDNRVQCERKICIPLEAYTRRLGLDALLPTDKATAISIAEQEAKLAKSIEICDDESRELEEVVNSVGTTTLNGYFSVGLLSVIWDLALDSIPHSTLSGQMVLAVVRLAVPLIKMSLHNTLGFCTVVDDSILFKNNSIASRAARAMCSALRGERTEISMNRADKEITIQRATFEELGTDEEWGSVEIEIKEHGSERERKKLEYELELSAELEEAFSRTGQIIRQVAQMDRVVPEEIVVVLALALTRNTIFIRDMLEFVQFCSEPEELYEVASDLDLSENEMQMINGVLASFASIVQEELHRSDKEMVHQAFSSLGLKPYRGNPFKWNHIRIFSIKNAPQHLQISGPRKMKLPKGKGAYLKLEDGAIRLKNMLKRVARSLVPDEIALGSHQLGYLKWKTGRTSESESWDDVTSKAVSGWMGVEVSRWALGLAFEGTLKIKKDSPIASYLPEYTKCDEGSSVFHPLKGYVLNGLHFLWDPVGKRVLWQPFQYSDLYEISWSMKSRMFHCSLADMRSGDNDLLETVSVKILGHVGD